MIKQRKKASELIDIVLNHARVMGISEQACVNAEIDIEDYTECVNDVVEYLKKIKK